MKTLLTSLLLLSSLACAQSAFQARAVQGALFNQTFCGGSGCVTSTRVSTSSSSGFTSPAQVQFEHVNGKDFNISPDNGVVTFGGVQLSTGSFLSGDLASTALFDVDQSYVTISSNGLCGRFKADGTCKAGGFTPHTLTLFVGVFVGRISWSTNPDNSHVLMGTVKGFVNGGTTAVLLNLVATTTPNPNPFLYSENLTTVSIAPF